MGLTQDQLAKAIGVERKAIIDYEKGRSGPDTDTLGKIVIELKTNHSWLAGEIDYAGALTERDNRILLAVHDPRIVTEDDYARILLDNRSNNKQLRGSG